MMIRNVLVHTQPRGRVLGLVCGLALALLAAAGCRLLGPTPFPSPAWPPGEYLTAKQAYARILPVAQEWDDEFVVIGMKVPWHRLPEFWPRPDGTANNWDFTLSSPTKWTEIYYSSDGSIYDATCWQDKPGYDCNHDEPLGAEELARIAIPMDEIMDSDKAAVIMQAQGVPDTAQLRSISDTNLFSESHSREFVWRFQFEMPDSALPAVFVDMLAGEVVYNEFATLTWTPGEYITAKQAYARILPAAQEWDDEFVVTGLSAFSGHLLHLDGTSPRWDFTLSSPTRWAKIRYLEGGFVHVATCYEDNCDHNEPLGVEELAQIAIPMDKIIDSDKAATIVQAQGIPDTAQLTNIWRFSGSRSRELVWGFMFKLLDGTHGTLLSVYVDMLTGEVVYNEFVDPKLPLQPAQDLNP